MIRVDLRTFPKFIKHDRESPDGFTLEPYHRMSIARAKEFFRETHNIEIEVVTGEPFHVIYMNEQEYIWFKLKWS